MSPSSFSHVGIAVRNIEDALPFYRHLEPEARVEIEAVPDLKVRVAKIHLSNACLELIEPQAGETAITRFLEKRGEGIHHICLGVPDVDAATKDLLARGYHPVFPQAMDGSGNTRVNFLSPKDTHGVLIEINSPRP
ncbi:MAG: VOC family protein [Planctomycetes bacterium]|nr:VOC family protein [Planctomycetota bacterium]